MRYPPPLPFELPPRPVKRETRAVWRAVVALRKAELFHDENGQLQGSVRRVHRLSKKTHVVDGHQVTTRELMRLSRAATSRRS